MIKNKRIKKNIEAMKFELSKGQELTPFIFLALIQDSGGLMT